MRFNRKTSIPSKYILLGLTFVCIVFLILSVLFQNVVKPFQYFTGAVITPMQGGINFVGEWVNSKFDSLQDIQNLMTENEELKAQLEDYQTENKIRQQDMNELADLRELYELDERYPSYNKIAARVISKDSGNWFNTFIIDKGTKDGITVDCNVLAGNGLVGIVTEVGPNYAKVRAIIDDSSNVSAMFLTDSSSCIISGDQRMIENGYITVKNIDKQSRVSDGDVVVTSNTSDKYLPGLTIGYVSELSVDSNNLTMSGHITPVVDFKRLQNVLVITDLKENYQEESE